MSTAFSRKIQPAYAHNPDAGGKNGPALARASRRRGHQGFGREAEARARFDAANQACFDQQQGIFWQVSLFSPASVS